MFFGNRKKNKDTIIDARIDEELAKIAGDKAKQSKSVSDKDKFLRKEKAWQDSDTTAYTNNEIQDAVGRDIGSQNKSAKNNENQFAAGKSSENNHHDSTNMQINNKDDVSKKTVLAETDLQQEKINPTDKSDQKRFVRESCESAMENDRQIRDAKKEYEKVTSQLTDIQKIDRISGDERKELTDVCKNIVNLVKERNQYKNRNLTITDMQMRKFEPYEEELVDEIKKMYSAESYQRAIESDISNLQKEKRLLYDERQEIFEKQNALKGMAKILSVLIVSLFVLFIVIYYALEVDMTFPYLGTILLAAVSATVIFLESNKNRRDIIINERKVNKAISLMNRVKIKYVNNVNMLDYNCEKFGVKSAKDFESKWNEYCRMKEYERRFKENTEKLNFNSECLVDLLRENEIADRDIWVSQAIAIVDNREMVEIRHELNTRRQKLRERIEYNEQVKAGIVRQIDELIKQYPHMQKELLAIVKEYSEEQ